MYVCVLGMRTLNKRGRAQAGLKLGLCLRRTESVCVLCCVCVCVVVVVVAGDVP